MRQGGVVTLLFTDLVGSTELLDRLGDEDAEALRRAHFRLLRQAVTAHGGEEVKNLGDGLMVAFPSAVGALHCAVAMQQAVARHNRSTDHPLGVRAGLHVGEPIIDEADYFGTPVVVAKRLCDQAQGGQILASDLVRALVGTRGGFRFKDMGPMALKGLSDPTAVCEVLWEPLAPPAPGLPAALAGDEPFVGRQAELGELEGAWQRAADGHRQVVLVAGEPGIGKTSLARQLARRAEGAGTVLYGRCDEEALIPYQPFVEALTHYLGRQAPGEIEARLGRVLDDVAVLLPGVGAQSERSRPPSPAGDVELERYRLFEGVAELLDVAAEARPLLLVLDDLHWADKPTMLLLRHVLRRQRATAMLVVGTYRKSDLTRTHPFTELLADLRRDYPFARVQLVGLTADDVAALLAGPGEEPGEQDRALAPALWRETEGNPFFLNEIIRHLREAGALRHTAEGWEPAPGLDELGIPEGIREVIGRRMSRLSPAANHVLTISAVVGREFRYPVLEQLCDLSEDELLDALEDAINAELIVEVDEVGAYTFSHALVRQTLYEEISTARRMKLHRRVGQALEAMGAGDEAQVAELAHHFFLAAAPAAEHDKAVDYAMRAARDAVERLAFEDAVCHLERALQVLDTTDAGDARRAEVLVALGEAQRRAGDPAYRQTLLDAGRLAGAAGDARLLAGAALANSRAVFSRTGQVDPERVALLEAAVAAVGASDDSDDEVVARLLASLGGELLFSGDRDRRVKLSDRALATARRVGDVPTLAHVLTHRHDTIWHASTLAERLTLAEELTGLAAGLGDTRGRYNAALIGIGPALEAGDLGLARDRVEVARAAAVELAEPVLRWFVAMPEAVLAMTSGDLDEGERLVEAAFELAAGTGQPDASLAFGAQLFTLRLLQGRLAEVGDDLVGAVAGSDAGPVVEAGLAWLACEVGQPEAARDILERLAAGRFGAVPDDLSWLAAMVACAEVAACLGDQARAAALVPLLEPYRDQFVTIAATVWWGSVAHYLGRLQTCLGRFYEAEADLAAAVEAYTRLGAEPWLARARRDQQTLADCRS